MVRHPHQPSSGHRTRKVPARHPDRKILLILIGHPAPDDITSGSASRFPAGDLDIDSGARGPVVRPYDRRDAGRMLRSAGRRGQNPSPVDERAAALKLAVVEQRNRPSPFVRIGRSTTFDGACPRGGQESGSDQPRGRSRRRTIFPIGADLCPRTTWFQEFARVKPAPAHRIERAHIPYFSVHKGILFASNRPYSGRQTGAELGSDAGFDAFSRKAAWTAPDVRVSTRTRAGPACEARQFPRL